MTTPGDRPLSALLSQLLVAYTVELDNEFERRMAAAGDPGARLSLVIWLNLLRFVGTGSPSVRELAAQALATDEEVKPQLGCLERWRFLTLTPGEGSRPAPTRLHRQSGRERRAGWGSGRGLGPHWRAELTARGETASATWPPLLDLVERGWERRFGEVAVSELRAALAAISSQLPMELPEALPADLLGMRPYRQSADSVAVGAAAGRPRLPTLLARTLLAFRIEFDGDSTTPLSLCANTLRVLGKTPTRLAEIPALTGCSPETAGIGWQVKPYLTVSDDPAGRRGKVACLSPRGLRAQKNYRQLTVTIEQRWEQRFGACAMRRLRAGMAHMFDAEDASGPLLAQGLVPPPGTARAGEAVPALGRRLPGPAALQRTHDLVAQTERFIADPAASLPHYPLWDMNRGFGP